MKVLVVESDRDMLAFLELVLLTGRHDMQALGQGAPAIWTLRKAAPDVLLCDLGLPDIHGEAVASAASELPRPPKIVLMSGEPARLERARPLASAILHKPFEAKALLELLDSLTP